MDIKNVIRSTADGKTSVVSTVKGAVVAGQSFGGSSSVVSTVTSSPTSASRVTEPIETEVKSVVRVTDGTTSVTRSAGGGFIPLAVPVEQVCGFAASSVTTSTVNPPGTAQTVVANQIYDLLLQHVQNKNNPHEITASELGAIENFAADAGQVMQYDGSGWVAVSPAYSYGGVTLEGPASTPAETAVAQTNPDGSFAGWGVPLLLDSGPLELSASAISIASDASTTIGNTTDDSQLIIQTNSGQTANPIEVLDSTGSPIYSLTRNVGTKKKYPNTTPFQDIFEWQNVAGFFRANTYTGTILIQFPFKETSGYLNFELYGWRYVAGAYNGNWTATVGGTDWTDGIAPTWHGAGSIYYGNPPFTKIRFGRTATGVCVLLGTTSTSWVSPLIVLKRLASNKDVLTGGEVVISMITDESGITIDRDAQPLSQSLLSLTNLQKPAEVPLSADDTRNRYEVAVPGGVYARLGVYGNTTIPEWPKERGYIQCGYTSNEVLFYPLHLQPRGGVVLFGGGSTTGGDVGLYRSAAGVLRVCTATYTGANRASLDAKTISLTASAVSDRMLVLTHAVSAANTDDFIQCKESSGTVSFAAHPNGITIKHGHQFISNGTGGCIIKTGGAQYVFMATYCSIPAASITIGSPYGPAGSNSITITRTSNKKATLNGSLTVTTPFVDSPGLTINGIADQTSPHIVINDSTGNIIAAVGSLGGISEYTQFAVSPATEIEVGDMLYLDAGTVHPAGDFPWDTNLSTTQTQFAAQFVGIAVDASPAGSTTPISVDFGSTHRLMACSADQYLVGEYLAPQETISALASQSLTKVAVASQSIGRAITKTTALSETVVTRFYSPLR